MGKGAGGTHEHLPTVTVCRDCHNGLHAQEWTLSLNGTLAYGYAGEIQLFVRAISLDDKSGDPRAWTDERLAAEWDTAEEQTRQNMGRMALVAFTLWERYGWADKRREGWAWYERAAELITQHTGRRVHWRDVYRLVDIYRAFREQAGEVIDELGPRLALAASRTTETTPEYALNWVRAARLNDHTVVEVEEGLKNNFVTVQSSEPCSVHCESCGQDVRHRKRIQEASDVAKPTRNTRTA